MTRAASGRSAPPRSGPEPARAVRGRAATRQAAVDRGGQGARGGGTWAPPTPKNSPVREPRLPLVLVPRTDETYRRYQAMFAAHAAEQPPPSEDVIFVGYGSELVCGVSLYPTAGPYLFAEHLATNPRAPLRMRHRAVVLLLRALRAYSAMRSKYPMVVIRHRSLIRMLTREGFAHQAAVLMSAAPALPVG